MRVFIFSLFFILATMSASFAQTCYNTIVASTPTERFTDHGDGTVTDNITDLMWKVCSEGQNYSSSVGSCEGVATTYTWQEAMWRVSVVNNAGFAGQSDWRLPNNKELFSIIEHQCFDPTINLEIFPMAQSGIFWSASPDASSIENAWFVNFGNGLDYSYPKTYRAKVRLVRGGL